MTADDHGGDASRGPSLGALGNPALQCLLQTDQESAMAKAKKQRRNSIRTMPTQDSTDALDALDRLDELEREARARADDQAGEADATTDDPDAVERSS